MRMISGGGKGAHVMDTWWKNESIGESMNGYWLAGMGLVTGGVLGGILGGYYLRSRETEAERLCREGNQRAREITVQAFREMIRQNPKISLDEAILRFEKTPANNGNFSNDYTGDLEHLARSKTRTVDAYRQSYEKYFQEARRHEQMIKNDKSE